jgi:hypothetical protein
MADATLDRFPQFLKSLEAGERLVRLRANQLETAVKDVKLTCLAFYTDIERQQSELMPLNTEEKD